MPDSLDLRVEVKRLRAELARCNADNVVLTARLAAQSGYAENERIAELEALAEERYVEVRLLRAQLAAARDPQPARLPGNEP